jgi:WD40 repeat protein
MSATLRSSYPLACLTALALLTGVARAEQGRTTPGLVIETGARTAYCDQLVFSPNGNHLLAVGEDKVLRRWDVTARGFLKAESINVRWPIQREARGSIFSVDYDRAGGRVAFAGYGLKTGLVATARLTPTGGEIESVCDPVPSPEVNWAVSFSPDGEYVLYGNETGEIYRWKPGTKEMPTLFASSRAKSRAANRVRLLAFVGAQKFVTVTMDGEVREWDVAAPNAAPARSPPRRSCCPTPTAPSPCGPWRSTATATRSRSAATRRRSWAPRTSCG